MRSISQVMNVAVALVLAAVVAACGSEKNNGAGQTGPGGVASGIYGTWGGFPPITSDGTTLTFKLKIESNQITNLVTCTMGGRSVNASATARAEITATKLKVVEAKEHVARDGEITCRASVHVGESDYRLDGDRLTLSNEQGEVLLRRVN